MVTGLMLATPHTYSLEMLTQLGGWVGGWVGGAGGRGRGGGHTTALGWVQQYDEPRAQQIPCIVL